MMDCKKALTETGGDLEAAAEYLQIKGIAKAAKKADRVAAEGIVAAWVSDDARTAGLVEINCETDFVARNEEFIAFADALAQHVGATDYADLDALLASPFAGSTVDETRKAKIASIGENISVRRFERVSLDAPGVVSAYIHGGGKIGVLVVLDADGDVAGDERAVEAARDIAMHVAAMRPLYNRVDEIPEEEVEREKRVRTEQAVESGKPQEIAEKMVLGGIAKWKKEICAIEQAFVKDPGMTVGAFAISVGKDIGVGLTFNRFVRYERGEGIEKVTSNLADEVAAQLR
jgi:elongation factor Ts